MKKFIFSVALLVAGLVTSAAQTYTAFVAMKLGDSPELKIRESASFSPTVLDYGYDIAAYSAGGIVVSATLNSQNRWLQWATDNAEGIALEVTPTAATMNLVVSSASGSDLYLIDAKDNSRTKLAAGTYPLAFEASEVGVANATRFSISKIAEKNLCFNYNKLQLTLYKGEKVEVYEPGAATPTISKDVTSDVFEIDLSDKTKGMYKVKLVNANKEYFIDVKPDVTVVP